MQQSKLTVFFEAPFWVAVYERISGRQLEACKITFGAEPKDYEVYDFFLTHWDTLKFSPTVPAAINAEGRINPKRRQRQVKKELAVPGVGTKAQQALKAGQAEGKKAREKKSRQEKEARQQFLFILKQKKRKEKQRGH